MKQTTVTLIFEKFNLLSDRDFKSWMLNNYDELFEMEKKQIKKAWADGNYNTDSNGNPSENYVISDDSYYQKTFKSE